MSLLDTLRRDYRALPKLGATPAPTADDRTKAKLLSTLIGEAETAERRHDPARPLTDAEVLAIIGKFAKSNAQAQAEVARLPEPRRNVELAKLKAEEAVLQAYLPCPLSDDKLAALVRERVDAGEREMGKIMGWLKANHAGRYDGKAAAAVVKSVLAGV